MLASVQQEAPQTCLCITNAAVKPSDSMAVVPSCCRLTSISQIHLGDRREHLLQVGWCAAWRNCEGPLGIFQRQLGHMSRVQAVHCPSFAVGCWRLPHMPAEPEPGALSVSVCSPGVPRVQRPSTCTRQQTA